MAENETTINNLPMDVLRQIMLRLAVAPNGEFYILRSFFICKSLHKALSHDEGILKAAQFKELSKYCANFCDVAWWEENNPELENQFKAFSYIGGFIFRAAKAGNYMAELILAKLIIRSAAELYQAQNEMSSSKQRWVAGETKLSTLAKASLFIAHFKVSPNDPRPSSSAGKLVHYKLVKKFLEQASFEELRTMKTYLQDYTSYFVDPSVKVDHYDKFLILLEELDEVHPALSLHATAHSFVTAFNRLCVRGCKTMRILGINNFPKVNDLRLPVVRENNCMRPDFLLEHFEMVDKLFREAINEAMVRRNNNGNFPLRNSTISRLIQRIDVAKECLSAHLQLIQFIIKIQTGIISEYDAMFLV